MACPLERQSQQVRSPKTDEGTFRTEDCLWWIDLMLCWPLSSVEPIAYTMSCKCDMFLHIQLTPMCVPVQTTRYCAWSRNVLKLCQNMYLIVIQCNCFPSFQSLSQCAVSTSWALQFESLYHDAVFHRQAKQLSAATYNSSLLNFDNRTCGVSSIVHAKLRQYFTHDRLYVRLFVKPVQDAQDTSNGNPTSAIHVKSCFISQLKFNQNHRHMFTRETHKWPNANHSCNCTSTMSRI